MPLLDLTGADDILIAGQSALEIRVADTTIWTKTGGEPVKPADQIWFVFETTTPGQAATVYLGGCGVGSTIDWGDGTIDTMGTASAVSARAHTYAAPGRYTAVFTGTVASIGSTGQTAAVMAPLVDVPHLGGACGVTNMSSMFYGAAAFNGDVSGWDTSQVTSMTYMFYGASSFNGDVSGWDTSSATNMSNMFNGATAFNAANHDLSGWPVPLIATTPTNFTNATVAQWPLDRRPQWGTWGAWEPHGAAAFELAARATWEADGGEPYA